MKVPGTEGRNGTRAGTWPCAPPGRGRHLSLSIAALHAPRGSPTRRNQSHATAKVQVPFISSLQSSAELWRPANKYYSLLPGAKAKLRFGGGGQTSKIPRRWGRRGDKRGAQRLRSWCRFATVGGNLIC